MATVTWIGNAQAVAEVKSVTVTAFDAATSYRLTVNEKTIAVPGNTSTTQTATDLAAAWNASAFPEVAEITATSVGAVVTLTHDTAGVPFTVTSSVSGGTGTMGAVSTTTTATGPWFWNNAANWSTGSSPVSMDIVWFTGNDVPVRYGLAQAGVTLAELHIEPSYTGDIGLPHINANGYREYRAQYLAISATLLDIEGSGIRRINTGVNQTTVHISVDSSGVENGVEPITLLGIHASNVINVNRGSVGVAIFPGEVSTYPVVRVGNEGNTVSDVNARFGSGTTLAAITQNGGVLRTASNITTLDKFDGEAILEDGNVTTLNNHRGDVVYLGPGTITTLLVGNEGVVDFSDRMIPRTVTNTTILEGGSLLDPAGTVTFTNPIRLHQCGLPDVELDVGRHRTYAIGGP